MHYGQLMSTIGVLLVMNKGNNIIYAFSCSMDSCHKITTMDIDESQQSTATKGSKSITLDGLNWVNFLVSP